MILGWADEFHQQKRRWPHHFDGPIPQSGDETWAKVNSALARGDRGLPGESSLARLLYTHRGVRTPRNVPDLDVQQIVAWAKAHFGRTGRWPEGHSGPIHDAPGESWAAVDLALRRGRRGLPGGSSLSQLLDARGVKPNLQNRPRFSKQQILSLADDFFQTHGHWPYRDSGPVVGLPGETWRTIDKALRRGSRGLPVGSSLVALLDQNRGILGGGKKRRKRIRESDRLRLDQITTWGKTYFDQTGVFPNRDSGKIRGAPGMKWSTVDAALKHGNRGLPGGSSLAKLFGDRRKWSKR